MQRLRVGQPVLRRILFACLLMTLPAVHAFAQPRPSTTSGAAVVAKTRVVVDTSKRVASTVIGAILLPQVVTRSFPAPSPCVGAPTVTRRHADSISVPELRKMTLQRARALMASMRLRLDERIGGAPGQPDVVIAQSPSSTVYVAPGDVVIVCSLPPNVQDAIVVTTPDVTAPVVRMVRMPLLIDSSHARATAVLARLFRMGHLRPPVSLLGAKGEDYDPARSVVVSQRPTPGTVLTPRDSIVIAFRDTTTIIDQPPPPAPIAIESPSHAAKPDTTTAVPTSTQTSSATNATAPTKQQGQTKPARLTPPVSESTKAPVVIPPVVPATPSRDASISLRPPVRNAFWKWIAAAAALLAAVVATTKLTDRVRLGRMLVVPHADIGRARVVFSSHGAESAEAELARLGLTVKGVADPGSSHLRFPRPPRVRNEMSDV